MKFKNRQLFPPAWFIGGILGLGAAYTFWEGIAFLGLPLMVASLAVILGNRTRNVEIAINQGGIQIHWCFLGIRYRSVARQFDEVRCGDEQIRLLHKEELAIKFDGASEINENKPTSVSIWCGSKTYDMGAPESAEDIFNYLHEQLCEKRK